MIKRIESGISCKGIDFDCLFFIKEVALHFGLGGVVFIKHDGSVKIIAEGEEENLKNFAKKIKHKISLYPIENFYTSWHEPTGEFKSFEIH